MKVAIVMTYFERQQQLNNTLASLHNTAHNDFEVIIVDDASPTPAILPPTDYPIYMHCIIEKQWHNPEPAYNTGIIHALRRGADIIIVQNAECLHVGDVITRAAAVTDKEYISFGCFSINERAFKQGYDLSELIQSNNFGAGYDGQNAWYNHPQYRPVGYDFCAAMTRKTMLLLNGYDERLSAGIGFGDDYLLYRVRLLGLPVEITAQPFVVHQWHYTGAGVPKNKAQLVEQNRRLFMQLKQAAQFRSFVRAKHIYTNDFESITCEPVAG